MNTSKELASRNHPLGFAERTRKNLAAIEEAAADGKDVHIVAQVATSLLGLVAFPWEKGFVGHIKALRLSDLAQEGWPHWDISLGSCDTLGQLARKLRNAIAHGHLSFSSESHVLSEVDIRLVDYAKGAKQPHWCATMRADQLREFCLRFIALVNERVGLS